MRADYSGFTKSGRFRVWFGVHTFKYVDDETVYYSIILFGVEIVVWKTPL